jgi:hypothetical protein
MNSVIISDYGVMLAKTGERLVIRGPKPRLELIEGGPQLFLPLGVNHKRPTLYLFWLWLIQIKNSGTRCPQVHRRDAQLDPRACGPCGQRFPPGLFCS